MTTSVAPGRARVLLRAACLSLIGVAVLRLAQVLPTWIAGETPAYPSQYLGRLYFALVEVPILAVSFLALGPRLRLVPRWRKVAPWVLLAISGLAMVLEMVLEARRP
jgi:hypothetical protein